MTHRRFASKIVPAFAAVALVCIVAALATAQRHTAKQDGDVVALADTTTKMNVEVVTSMGNAWKIQVNGQNLVRTSPSLDPFEANSGMNGMPLLAPFANRLDETAFYANGKKYNFDLELGNVRRPSSLPAART
jgi:aldose 1-epimerase